MPSKCGTTCSTQVRNGAPPSYSSEHKKGTRVRKQVGAFQRQPKQTTSVAVILQLVVYVGSGTHAFS